MNDVKSLVEGGKSLNRAIKEVLPAGRRSWAIRRWGAFLESGMEALFDTRVPREPRVSRRIRASIEAAVRETPKVRFADAVRSLDEQSIPLPSAATLKRELALARDRTRDRRRPLSTGTKTEVVNLTFAGGELLLAAELETGAVGALTAEVCALAKEALEASAGREHVPDSARRDADGHFTESYNRHRRREAGQDIASYLRTAEEKAVGRVPSWPRFVHEQASTIEAKLMMMVLEPMVSRTKGWEGLRSAEARGLEPLTGFSYMPSTLAKFCSALAISGAGPRLLAAAGRTWHTVAQERWHEEGAMAALYVDNHAKEVWSSLYTQSGKVSHLNRVMPAITTTYAHTGAGTPMVLAIQSGSAPLAPALVGLVDRAESALGDGIGRAVVIDSEGSTFDILETFTKRRRVVITPLRSARAPELELRFTRGSYYRPYRDNDELRIATATLHHRSTARSLDVGVLLVRREHRDSETVLLTTGLALGMEGRELADLYFARWPIQENWFKAGAAVGLNEHRGNCGRMVANVAIVTETERLRARLEIMHRQATELRTAQDDLVCAAGRALLEYERAERRLDRGRVQLDRLVAEERTRTQRFVNAATKHHELLAASEQTKATFERALTEVDRSRDRLAKLEPSITKAEARLSQTAHQQRVRRLDVALDSILTATKLTAAQLVSFVLREYLCDTSMDITSFVARVFTIPGKRERREGEERVVFYANPRDPKVTEALTKACERLTRRHLRRDGRRLTYVVEDQPPEGRSA